MAPARKKPRTAASTNHEDSDPRSLAQEAVPIEQRQSEVFEAYYRAQLFGHERGNAYGTAEEFFDALTRPSPMTLRLHRTAPAEFRRRAAEEVTRPPLCLPPHAKRSETF